MKNLKRRRTGQFLQDPLVSGRRNFRKKSEKNQLESHFLFYEHEVFEHQDKKISTMYKFYLFRKYSVLEYRDNNLLVSLNKYTLNIVSI